MKIPRIKLQWATAKQQPGNWYLGLLGFYERKSGGRSRGLAISVRGILLWGLAACVAGYFAAAGYVLWKWEQRAYNYVRYADILLYPIRKDEINKLRGQAMIAEGFDQLRANNWRGGVQLLRIGLDKYPRDLKARLEIAKFFLAAKVRAKAQETLLGGFSDTYPGRTYIEAAVMVASSGEDNELVIEICNRALALHQKGRHPDSDRRWLVEQHIRALLAEERSADALAFAEAQAGDIDDAVLSEPRLLALIQARRLPEAVTFVEAWRARAGATPQVLRLQARVYRESGRIDDMSAVLEEIVRQNPTDARSRVFSIIQNLLAGSDAAGRAQIDDYIFRFGGTPENYSLLAEPLAEIKRRPELESVVAAAADRGIRAPRLAAARLQVLISERDWAEANRQLDVVRALLPADALGRATLLELLNVLIAAASDPAEGRQSTLVDYIALRQLPMSAYRQCIDVLRSAGRTETARQVVRLAEGVFPANRYLVATRGSLDAEIAAVKAAAEASRVVKTADAAFASPAAFYPALAEAEKTGGPSAALALARELRVLRPNWLPDEDANLAYQELQLHAKGDDIVALQGAVRRYLNNDQDRIRNTLTVATTLFEAGRKDEARLLLDEVLRRVPDQPSARALKTKWFPPKPAGAAAIPAPTSTPTEAK
ncbi:MAG: hypothetical protein H7067_12640 [Burkholderiales bacterium]|nr:hypothetical protein [Opitutaceae bacterium]